MKRNIKAIKTKYKSNWFRSRLEAKWAKYFDVLGIEYVYEPEGFSFENETYLPDFLIMGNTYIEVKPKEPTKEYIDKLKRFVKSIDGFLILLVGEPKPKDYVSYFINGDNGPVEEMDVFFNSYTVWKWGEKAIFWGNYYFSKGDEFYEKDLANCRKANNINNF